MTRIPIEVLKRIRQLEIKTRQIVNSVFTGEYHSAFKGQGINFSEVRNYFAGDDVRFIDWNVTARTGEPHLKLFDEERELTVILMVDISSSGDFGSVEKTKIQIAAEVAGVLGFSANNNQDKVGLLLFTDKVECYIPPKKGKDHIFRILRDIFYLKPTSKKTSITTAIEYLSKIAKRRAIVFLISDFVDANYERGLKLLASKHDVVPIIIEDKREQFLPKLGLMELEDSESGETIYVNTYSKQIREKFRNMILAKEFERDRYFKSIGIAPIYISTQKSYILPLIEYFKRRIK